MSPQLRAVTEAGLRASRRKERPWTIATADFFEDLERLRAQFSTLVAGDADGVAVIPAASYALSTVAANVAAGPGDRILVLAEQYPSNVYPWRHLAQRTGATVVGVARPGDGDWTRAVEQAIDERTVAVAVPHCHFTTGALLDLDRISRAVKAADALFVVDVTQSLGVLPLDALAAGADVVVAAGYKWLLGPYSVGYAWIAPQHRHWEPLEHHWAGRKGSENFATLTNYTDEYRTGARRFDGGEASNFALLPMALAALETVAEWTMPRIATGIAPLAHAIEQGARELGIAPHEGPRVDHLIGLRLPDGVADRVARQLAASQVYVSVRAGDLRVSPHVYNTTEDVDRFIDALRSAL